MLPGRGSPVSLAQDFCCCEFATRARHRPVPSTVSIGRSYRSCADLVVERAWSPAPSYSLSPNCAGSDPAQFQNPPIQLASAALGKASVASERPPEGEHAAPRQLQYPKPHPASLPQPTSSFVAPANTQWGCLKLRGVRPRAVSKPAVRLTSAARGKASVGPERPPEGGHAASRQLHYPSPHPTSLPQPTSATLPQPTPSRVTPTQTQPG